MKPFNSSVALLLHFQLFSIFIKLKLFSLHSVLFYVNIYPLSALCPDHILANYSICHCKLNCGFHSYQIQFSFAFLCYWYLPMCGLSHCQFSHCQFCWFLVYFYLVFTHYLLDKRLITFTS